MSQNLQQIPSLAPSQSSAAAIQQNPLQVTSLLQSHTPATLQQQYMHHPQAVSAAAQGQSFSGYQPKLAQNQQQVSAALPMEKMYQQMQYRQQTAASNPSHMSPSMQRGLMLPAQQPYFETSSLRSPQGMRPEAGGQKPHSLTPAL